MSYIEVTSALVLHADPLEPNHAVTKRYVDNKKSSVGAQSFTSGVIPISRMTALTGDISSVQGSGAATLSANGITAGTYPKVTIDSAGRISSGTTLVSGDIPSVPFSKVTTGKPTTAAGYGIGNLVSVTGGTVTGPITSTATPSANLDAVTKGYVDSSLTGIVSGTLAVGDIVRKPVATAPTGFLRCNGGYVDRTTYADLFGMVGYSLLTKVSLDYTTYAAVGGGQPWCQQYDFNTTQSGDLTGWSQTLINYGSSVLYASFAATKNKIYRLGGRVNDSPTSICAVTNVSDDGSLSMWSVSSNLALARERSTCFVVKNRIYLVGGGNSNPMDSVESAPINSDGSIGVWSLSAAAIPVPVFGSCSFVTKNRVYILGGFNNNGGYIPTVQTAAINSDGSLGTWSVDSSLPTPATYCTAIVIKNKVYVLGGMLGGSSSENVYVGTINSDGTLGGWTISSSILPFAVSGSQIVATRNKIYVLIVNTGKVIACPINSDGTLGNWYSLSDSPMVTVTGGGIIAVKNKLHIIGNATGGYSNSVYSASFSGGLNDYSKFYDGTINKFDGSNISGEITVQDQTDMGYTQPGNGQPWRQQYDINTTQSGDITGWGTDGGLPGVVGDAQVVVTKNKVHLLGGVTGANYSQSIFSGVIDAGGNIGQWAISATLLPKTIAESQAVVTKNRVHLLGGRIEGSFSSTVYTAPINTDGTLGTWGTGTQLTGNTGQAAAAVTRNSVYLIGGVQSGNYTANIQAAAINTDGTLGVWLNVGSLPAPVASASVIVTKNRIYLLGGYNNSGYLNTIYSCSINNDGTLGNWTTSVPLPVIMREFQTVVTRNAVYLLGGMYGSSSSEVYYAPINSDGTLGTWRLSVSLSTSLGKSQAVATKNKIYLLGGYAGGSYNSVVYSAPFSGGLNDYSPYYNGTIVAAEPTQFKLPDFTAAETSGVNYYIKY